jgi:hypothetical protein
MLRRILFAACLVVLLAGVATAAPPVVDLGADTGLEEPGMTDDWADGDPVAVTPTRLDMRIQIAHQAATVDLSEWRHVDAGNTYLRVQYNESIERRIVFLVPDSYWPPYAAELDAEDADVTAEFRSTVDTEYTRVEITVSEATDARFTIQEETALLFEGRRRARSLLENRTGLDVPTLSASSSWQQLGNRSLAGDNQTVDIDTQGDEVVIQYDDAPSEATNWVPVRECTDGTTEVCRFTRSDANETVYLLSRDTTPPAIRYKIGGGLLERTLGSINEIDSLIGDIPEMLEDLTPW